LQVSFRNVAHSDTTERLVIQKASKLARFSKQIISCRVVLELPHRHHHRGNHYNVHIGVSVPGREIVITRDSTDSKNHENLNLALIDAFEAAERQLDEYVELKRGA
jgi:ribosome-associated translation inhibitor RaiA